MPLVLPLLVLFALPIDFGKEIPLSPPETVIAGPTQSGAMVATDGKGFLVVWTDSRGSVGDLYAARVDAEGRTLDPLGILLHKFAYTGGVVWNGERYLVAAVTGGYDVSVVSVSPAGVVGEAQKVIGGATSIGGLAMTTNGETALLVASGGVGALLDRDGRNIGTLRFPSSGTFGARAIGAATSRSGYLIALAMRDSIAMHDVSASGVVGAPATIPWNPGPAGLHVASDGERFLVTWTDASVHWQLFRTAGSPITDVQTNEREPPKTNGKFVLPRAVWRGTEFLLTYGSVDGQAWKALRTNGLTITGSPMHFADVPGGFADLAATSNGAGLATWIRVGGGLMTARFDPSSVAAGLPFFDARPIAHHAHPQFAPRLVDANDQLFAVWTEVIDGEHVLRASRVGATPVTLGKSWQSSTFVFDGRDLWLVWIDNGVHAQRYGLDLARRGEELLLPGGGEALQSVAADGHDGVLVVTWPTKSKDLAGAHIEHDVAKPLAIAASPHYDGPARVVWNGREFVLVWVLTESSGWWQFPTLTSEVLARRLTLDGAFMDAEPIAIAPRGPSISGLEAAPAPGGAAIFWATWGLHPQQLGAIFTGAPLPAPRLIASSTRRIVTNVVPHAGGYVLATGEERGGKYELIELGPALEIRETVKIDLPAIGGFSLASLDGQLAAGYSRVGEAIPYGGVPRAFVRGVPPPSPRRRGITR